MRVAGEEMRGWADGMRERFVPDGAGRTPGVAGNGVGSGRCGGRAMGCSGFTGAPGRLGGTTM